MITLSYEEFLMACPSATNPSEQLFRDIEGIIEESAEKLIEVVGPAIAERLDKIQEGQLAPETTPEWLALKYAKKYVALDAYATAIPQLDLVLTNTGFGVVSNQNVAPASSDRVARLLERVLRSKDDIFDRFLSNLRRIAGWGDSPEAMRHISSIFWRSNLMKFFGLAAPTRSDLHRYAVDIAAGEAALKKLMGREQWQALLEYERNGKYDIMIDELITDCRRFVAVMASGRDPELYRRSILALLDSSEEIFAPYHQSSACKANHFEPYRNRKDDTTFFFGSCR